MGNEIQLVPCCLPLVVWQVVLSGLRDANEGEEETQELGIWVVHLAAPGWLSSQIHIPTSKHHR